MGCGGTLIVVESGGLTVEDNGLEQQMIVGCALHLDGQVIPGIIVGIAGDAGGMPLLSLVIPDVPLMAAGDTTFVSPDEGLAVHELIDIELESLGGGDISAVEVDVVSEIVGVGVNFLIHVGEAVGRKITDEVIVPERVSVLSLAADVELGCIPAHGRRTHALFHGPGHLRSIRTARVADGVGEREETVTSPSAALMQIGEGVPRRRRPTARVGTAGGGLADRDRDRSRGGAAAIVPLLDGGVIGAGSQR